MQLTKNKYANLNALGVTVKVDVIPAVEASWSNILLPGISANKDYCRFASVPLSWGWDISTSSDAANVAITASWNAW